MIIREPVKQVIKLITRMLACLIAFIPLQAHANIDSLQQVITQSQTPDTNLVWTHRHLFRAYYTAGQHDAMLETADNGLQLARELDFPSGINYMVYYKATALEILGRGEEAMPLFDEGIAVSYQMNDTLGAADYLINKGAGHYNLGNLDEALKNYLNAYEIYGQYDKQQKLSKTLNNIGVIYRTQKKYDRAEEIYRESVAIKKKLNDSLGLAASYLNLGALYGTMGKTEKALDFLQQSIALYQLLGQAAEVAGCHTSIGEIYVNAKRWEEAREALETADDYFHQNPQRNYASENLRLLGKVALETGKPSQAADYFAAAHARATTYGQQDELLEMLPSLAEANRQLGRYAQADKAMQEAFVLQDSMRSDNRLALQEEMQARFDVLQQEKALAINELELTHRTRQRDVLIGSMFGLLLLGILAFWMLGQRMLANRKIAELNAMLEGEEKERQRIASDLHDGLGGTLASLKSHFNQLPKPPEKQDVYDQTNRIIDRSYDEVRRISHNLAPQALGMAGLEATLDDLALELQSHDLDVELEMVGLDEKALGDRAVTVYRILQELSHNIVKHAEAKQVFIQLVQKEKLLTMMIEDDGKGFDIKTESARGGLGLGSVQSRVAFLNGEIEWDSVVGEGTTVSVRVPL